MGVLRAFATFDCLYHISNAFGDDRARRVGKYDKGVWCLVLFVRPNALRDFMDDMRRFAFRCVRYITCELIMKGFIDATKRAICGVCGRAGRGDAGRRRRVKARNCVSAHVYVYFVRARDN